MRASSIARDFFHEVSRDKRALPPVVAGFENLASFALEVERRRPPISIAGDDDACTTRSSVHMHMHTLVSRAKSSRDFGFSRSSVQQARPVYRSVRLPRRRAHHARSPRATKPRNDRELGEIITIRRLLIFFYISANKGRTRSGNALLKFAKKSFVSVLLEALTL